MRLEKSLKRFVMELEHLIETHGWTVYSAALQSPLSYTLGLWREQELPELLMLGVPVPTARVLLNQSAELLVRGEFRLEEGVNVLNIAKNLPVRFRPLTDEQVQRHLSLAIAINKSVPRVWQLVWPDREGRFPGESGCSLEIGAQQDLSLQLGSLQALPGFLKMHPEA